MVRWVEVNHREKNWNPPKKNWRKTRSVFFHDPRNSSFFSTFSFIQPSLVVLANVVHFGAWKISEKKAASEKWRRERRNGISEWNFMWKKRKEATEEELNGEGSQYNTKYGEKREKNKWKNFEWNGKWDDDEMKWGTGCNSTRLLLTTFILPFNSFRVLFAFTVSCYTGVCLSAHSTK